MSAPALNTHHIGIVLFDDVEELDAVGPWEVLAHWALEYPEDGWSVSMMSRDGETVNASKGLVMGAHHSFSDGPKLDLLIHPGGQGTRPLLRDPDHVAWIQQQAAVVPVMTSVCTGALVFAAAGLLSHRPATTHWQQLEDLARLDPTIEVRPDDRFVDDGNLITSAGVSAGIDMALHLVARFASPDRAREVRAGIQYDPQPPV